MRWLLVLVVLAGCQTVEEARTGRQTEFAHTSGISRYGVCDVMPIKTTKSVRPLNDKDCHVSTPVATFTGQTFTVYYVSTAKLWGAVVQYSEAKADTYMTPLDIWETIDRQWPDVAGRMRTRSGVLRSEIGGVPYRTAEFEMSDVNCLAFLAYGDYKGQGYDRRVLGYVCREGSRNRPDMEAVIASFNTRELLN